MPGRIAMGAAAWWEPVAAAALILAAIAGLIQLAGRVYTRAILHSGPALSLRDIWRDKTTMTGPDPAGHRVLVTVLTGIGVTAGVVAAVLTADVIIGVAGGAGFMAVVNQMARQWTRHAGPPAAHR